jgi:hypothetical protein|tara:strand:- start:221 stop:703 length:483 start_codon:yes stop_codon:yes gene_type:complete
MKLEVIRFSSQNDSTLGLLFDVTHGRKFLCFTLEDEARDTKVMGETRIPAGIYDLKLRTEGGYHNRFLKKFGSSFHKGMIWVQNVPNFRWILWHTGNTDDDTAGCLLLGDSSQQNVSKGGFIGASNDAYKRVYPVIAEAILSGQRVRVKYIDYDNGVRLS